MHCSKVERWMNVGVNVIASPWNHCLCHVTSDWVTDARGVLISWCKYDYYNPTYVCAAPVGTSRQRICARSSAWNTASERVVVVIEL